MTGKYFLLRFALSLKHKAMSEFTVTKSVGNLGIETDLGDLMIRVCEAGNVIRQIDCHDMSLNEYCRVISEITAEAEPTTFLNEN